MFLKQLSNAGHTRRYSITGAGVDYGWKALIQEDGRVVHQAHHGDWHRVERVLDAMNLQIPELRSSGWDETDPGKAAF